MSGNVVEQDEFLVKIQKSFLSFDGLHSVITLYYIGSLPLADFLSSKM
ncbi:MAG: hypothetical protein ACFFAO_14710 [Candidatus Hermodarchaeota archaeon]